MKERQNIIPGIIIPKASKLLFLFFLLGLFAKVEAQINPLLACQIAGVSTITLGSTSTFTLTGCSATSWTVTCGTIQTQSGTSVTVLFNVYGCSSSTITANGTTATPRTVSVTWAALNGGTISNSSQSINTGATPTLISASVATGGDCGTYSYQWYSSPDNSTFSTISSATGQNYQPPALSSTTYYKRQATCTGSSAYTTNTATVTVYPPIVPGSVTPATQPTINYGANASTLTSTGVSGGTNSYTYQWQNSSDNATWVNINGTSTTYTPLALTSTTYFRVAVTSNGLTAYSSSAVVSVYPQLPQLMPGIIAPQYITIASGSSPGTLSGDPASGGNGSYTYQWYSSTNGTSFSAVSGATSTSYAPPALTANMWYTRQVTSNGVAANSDTVQIVISSTAPDVNFIRVRDILKAGIMDSATAAGLTSPYDVAQTTQYFDGLGRQVQAVAMQESPLQHDLVSINVYDVLGREQFKYLPYTATTSDGNYKYTAQGDQYNFNAAQYPGENSYFGQSAFEPSPLNRVAVSYAPGLNWVGSGRGVAAQYQMNTAADSVRVWTIVSAPENVPTTPGTYAAGMLYKNITTDEAGHSVVEYKDLQGEVVLKKVQLAASPGTAHVGWLCTYYVYDTLTNLRFVIPPQAVNLINGSWAISIAIANELCFRYEYDYRKRMTIKKIPGAGEVWMVYDQRDRLAMTQDSNLRVLQKWLFSKYDIENRSDSTGTITDPSNYNNLTYHQNLAATSISYPTVTSYTNELLAQSYYDDYSWAAGAGMLSAINTTYTSNSTYFNTSYNTSPQYAVQITQFPITRGMATGSRKEMIGSNGAQYLYGVSFYDDRGRMIQSQSINYTGAKDTATTQYDFTGKPIRSLLNHAKAGNTAQAHIVVTKMDYDQAFRLRHIYKNIDNATSDQLIDSMQYNELGQLNAKYLGNNVDSLVYNYNVRGWLIGINKSYVAGTSNHYFGMELGYDKTTSSAPGNTYATPEYNGNIEGTVWKTMGSGTNRKYDFTYDYVNRLTAANFTQYNGSGFDVSAGIDFTTNNLSYDANGNILSMSQKGFMLGGSNYIDQLAYAYQSNSNKLSQVTDASNNPTSQLGDFHYTGTKGSYDYTYDGNGNLNLDNNKSISYIHYNYLNLPDSIVFTSKGYIKYVYDAAGTKWQKVTVDNAGSKKTVTTYVSGFVYQNTSPLLAAALIRCNLLHMRKEEQDGHCTSTQMALQHTSSSMTSLRRTIWEIREWYLRKKETQQIILLQWKLHIGARNRSSLPISPLPCCGMVSVPNSSSIPVRTKLAITNPNDSVAKVDYNGTSGQSSWPSLLLKVMGGDTVSIGVQSFWNSNSITTTNSSLNAVLASLGFCTCGYAFGWR